jgi:putative hydrolase of the HAD superfamily
MLTEAASLVSDKYIRKHMVSMKPRETGMVPEGRPKAQVRCILFDIYGTLFISGSGDISLARQSAEESGILADLLQRFGISETPEKLLGRFFGIIDKSHQKLKKCGVDFPEVQIDRIWMEVLHTKDHILAKRFAVEYELIVNPVFPMPHLRKTLEECCKRQVTMGIISNAQFFTPLLFEWFFGRTTESLGFSPDLIFYSWEHGCAKPSPHLFSLASAQLASMGISPSETCFVGNDMLNDILPAANAGMQTILFAGDSRSLRLRKENVKCRNLKSDMIITDLDQLSEVTGSATPTTNTNPAPGCSSNRSGA